MGDKINRLTRVALRTCQGLGVKGAVYANAQSFDVLTERGDGVFWVRNSMDDAYEYPLAVARSIRRQLKAAWRHPQKKGSELRPEYGGATKGGIRQLMGELVVATIDWHKKASGVAE